MLVAWLAGLFDTKISPTQIAAAQQKVVNKYTKPYKVVYVQKIVTEPVSATVSAKQTTMVSVQILARIDTIHVRAGDFVSKGDPLISLEKAALVSQLSQAQEKINATLVRYQEAEKNLIRANKLVEQKLISVFELDKAKANFQALNAALTAAKQLVEEAKVTLSYATLTAPIDGRVVDRFAEPGNIVQPGEKLLSLYNPLSLRIEANVREQLALTLQQTQKISVEIPAIKKVISAQIEEPGPAANTGSRSFLIKASLAFQQKLLPGMYARMLIPTDEERVLYVPQDKITQVGQLNFVWLNVKGEIQRRFVRLGESNDQGMTSIISGVEAGDILVSMENNLSRKL
jgi:RND family efflux transporter MFP subunit